MRIIVDVNIWIRGLVNASKTGVRLAEDGSVIQLSPFQDYVMDSLDSHTLLVSVALYKELRDKIEGPRLHKKITSEAIDKLFNILKSKATMIAVTSVVKGCRDDKDDYLLALAIDGEADYLISNDDDLLDMKRYGDTIIRNVTDMHLIPKSN